MASSVQLTIDGREELLDGKSAKRGPKGVRVGDIVIAEAAAGA